MAFLDLNGLQIPKSPEGGPRAVAGSSAVAASLGSGEHRGGSGGSSSSRKSKGISLRPTKPGGDEVEVDVDARAGGEEPEQLQVCMCVCVVFHGCTWGRQGFERRGVDGAAGASGGHGPHRSACMRACVHACM